MKWATRGNRLRRAVAQGDVLQRPFRSAAARAIRRGKVRSGSTIVIVNWNSCAFLDVTLSAIERFTDRTDVDILVMDNASSDGSTAMLRERGVRYLRLPTNLGHEMAMDLGVLCSRRQHIIALDVDAFPVRTGWLEALIEPLKLGRADVSGVHVEGGFVHPCCLAMRLDRFVGQRHTFMARRSGRWADSADDVNARAWDTGWRISLREPRRHLFDRTEVRGPGNIGSVWEPIAYHNFYSTRFDARIPPSESETAIGVDRRAASEAWTWAVERFLGPPPAVDESSD